MPNGPLRRIELGIERIAVLFLEVVDDETRVGNSLLVIMICRRHCAVSPFSLCHDVLCSLMR
jgi:hypothetical protein